MIRDIQQRFAHTGRGYAKWLSARVLASISAQFSVPPASCRDSFGGLMVQRSSTTTAVFTASAQVVRRDPSQFQYVKLAFDNNVARLTLSRPDHNLLNEGMLRS